MNFYKQLLFVAAAISFHTAIGQDKDPVLMKIGEEKVLLSEFKTVYEKNNSNTQVAKSSPEEYLDLYVKFKLKVKQAMDLQMDTLPTFVQELSGYRKQLAQPYLTDEKTKDRLKKETYERLQQEVRASHILIRVDETASAADTLKAYKKAQEARNKVLGGSDFTAVAKEYSEDPSVRNNDGDLGYFTAMFMVYPFEKAAYDTKVGEMTDIVRTSYGYHIIKVTDKRKARGDIQVAHILVRFNDGANQESVKDVAVPDSKKKVDEIYEKLMNGESFEELAALYSEDNKTAKSGGVLPPFGTGKMIQPFEDIAFELKEDGSYSQPFKTQFGYHIIKKIKSFPIPSYEEMESKIEKNLSRDAKKMYTTEAVVNRLKKEYDFKEMKNNLKPFFTVGNEFEDKKWNGEGIKKPNDVMATFANQKVTNQDFIDFLVKRTADLRKQDRNILIKKQYTDFINETMLDYEDTQLERKYPEFKALVQEYHDGILLFELTEDKVWNKAIVDTNGFKQFYEENILDYQWTERVDAVIYVANDKTIANATYKLVKKRYNKEWTPADIKKMVNETSQLNLEIMEGKFASQANPYIDKVVWVPSLSKPIEVDSKFVVIEILGVIEPGAKTIEEIRGKITSDYQDYLEKEWIKSLQETYPVDVNKEVLKSIK
jgi:peptidyl-prolyl cis-trans isomerase SurA